MSKLSLIPRRTNYRRLKLREGFNYRGIGDLTLLSIWFDVGKKAAKWGRAYIDSLHEILDTETAGGFGYLEIPLSLWFKPLSPLQSDVLPKRVFKKVKSVISCVCGYSSFWGCSW